MRVEVQQHSARKLYGLWRQSHDQTIATDIVALTHQYRQFTQKQATEVLPWIVLSRNYHIDTKEFELFVGSSFALDNLVNFTIPAGEYAKMIVKPKFLVSWGLAIGQAKRYFYTQWLPVNNYQALNLEYEYHTEASLKFFPQIELFFAIRS